jgi:hypothetical protein
MIQASALLHQFQRQRTADGQVIASRADYEVAALLLAGPLRRLLAVGVSEPARRFLDRLRGWFGDQTFSTRQARTKEVTSRRSVYGWLAELRAADLVKQESEPHGPTPATWSLTGLDQASAGVLPSVAEVFGG